jgi:hypothetical protein
MRSPYITGAARNCPGCTPPSPLPTMAYSPLSNGTSLSVELKADKATAMTGGPSAEQRMLSGIAVEPRLSDFFSSSFAQNSECALLGPSPSVGCAAVSQ